MCRRNKCGTPNALVVLLGFVFGISIALAWYFGFVDYVRQMIPFALAFAIVLFTTTAIFKALNGESSGKGPEKCYPSFRFCLCKYSPLLLISAAVFIAFSLLFLATYLPFAARVVMAFIGSISFWTMFFTFISMILCMPCRRQ